MIQMSAELNRHWRYLSSSRDNRIIAWIQLIWPFVRQLNRKGNNHFNTTQRMDCAACSNQKSNQNIKGKYPQSGDLEHNIHWVWAAEGSNEPGGRIGSFRCSNEVNIMLRSPRRRVFYFYIVLLFVFPRNEKKLASQKKNSSIKK